LRTHGSEVLTRSATTAELVRFSGEGKPRAWYPCPARLKVHSHQSVWLMCANTNRFDQLEKTVETLLQRVATLENESSQSSHPRSDSHCVPAAQHQNEEGSTPDQGSAPLFILRNVVTDSGVRGTEGASSRTSSREPSDDVLNKMISRDEALTLLSIFQENYGRWVSFDPTIPTLILLEDVRKSPLLLAACCLIAVRHTSQELASRLAPTLYREAKSLLSVAMLNTPQPVEYFQASLVLSMWSTTIAQIPLNTDSWLLSGFALQHSNATDLFRVKKTRSSDLKKSELNRLCLWNHICLVHLHYCVGTRRKALLDRNDIDKCRQILNSDQATNFETRMVAEVFLYWIIYESCNTAVDLPRTQAVLQSWKEEWQFLFDQPRSQFVQMGFCFAQLLTYDQSLKTSSAVARESLINEMVRLSTAIINLAMNTTDERTQHLTDHIYHMLGFAAITLSRLIHYHEEQLAASYDLHGLDSLILALVTWLHNIGLPCHVGHTMGDVVAAFHKKLRRNSGQSPSTSYAGIDPAIHDDFAQLFPELFSVSPYSEANPSLTEFEQLF